MATHRRAIINTDAKNEGDDQYAIVHALLSPSLDVRGIIPAHFGTWRSDRSMLDSRDEVDLLLELMQLSGQVVVANGAAVPIVDESTPVDSPGARLIIAESLLASRGRSAVRGVPGPVDRHGVGDPARSRHRRPAGDGDLDRRRGLRRPRPAAEDGVQPLQRHRGRERGVRLGHHAVAGAAQRLPDGVGLLHRAGGEDRRHQRARRLPDPPAEGVERRPPSRADRVPLPG